MERQCELAYYMHLPISDQMECEAFELRFMHEWVIERKTKEKELEEKING